MALFDQAAGKLDMQGWITLNNNSGTSFDSARVLLVAGTPAGGAEQYNRYRPPQPSGNRAGTESANRDKVGDYYVYPIAGRTTVANAQQKQVSFLSSSGVPATKGYAFRNEWQRGEDTSQSADTVLRFSTSRQAGLGDALPAGTVRVYVRDSKGQPQFIGENGIDHTPMGSGLAIRTGEAFDVKVKPSVQKRERIQADEWERSSKYRILVNGRPAYVVEREDAKTYWRTTMNYLVTNARSEPVKVEVIQAGLDRYWYPDTRVPSESIRGEQRSADERAWLVDVPANGEVTLSVQFDTRY